MVRSRGIESERGHGGCAWLSSLKEVVRERSNEPLDGPGSTVCTIPMSSMSLPWRGVGDLAGEDLGGDRGDRWEGLRPPIRNLSSRGRFVAWEWEGKLWRLFRAERGLETRDDEDEGGQSVSVESEAR